MPPLHHYIEERGKELKEMRHSSGPIIVSAKSVQDFHTASLTGLVDLIEKQISQMDTGAYHDEDYVKGYNAFRDSILTFLGRDTK